MKKVLHFALMFFISASVLSCKKDKGNNDGSALDLMRDSVFLYAKEAYYWNDGLPNYANFNARSFTGSNELDALSKEVDALSQYKINPATGKPYEYDKTSPGNAKYSFIDNGETSTVLGGSQGDFGFAPFYNILDNADLRIKYVYLGSPAAAAGVKRGDRVLSINGNSNVTYDSNGPVTQMVINAFYYSNNINLILERNGSRFNATVATGRYTTNPVLNYKVFEGAGGRKTGYFVFNIFTAEENATPKLNEVFNYFSSNGVTDLVIDLRYNGGGRVSTAEYLCNLIVPASKDKS